MEISISDTGEGIPLHFLPYVFDPFRQAVGGTTRPHPGLGLGLAIVRRLVELHGGVVKAESSGGEGQGATFTVILPAKSHATGADFVEREINHSFVQDRTVSDLTRLRVLVVEDERDSRELLTLVLTQFGATVTAVGSADEALKAIQQHEPDALVADIGLPDQDGFTLMRKIRSMERKGARMPAIAVTAYASLNDRQQAIDAGYDDHVGKPIEPDRVAAVLATVIQPRGKGTR
jgi:CheY-like chemotaxis protein